MRCWVGCQPNSLRGFFWLKRFMCTPGVVHATSPCMYVHNMAQDWCPPLLNSILKTLAMSIAALSVYRTTFPRFSITTTGSSNVLEIRKVALHGFQQGCKSSLFSCTSESISTKVGLDWPHGTGSVLGAPHCVWDIKNANLFISFWSHYYS